VNVCFDHCKGTWCKVRALFFGHITKVGQFCRYLLHCTLPPDAHERVKGRLHVSISSLLPVPHNHLQSEFTSREDLMVGGCMQVYAVFTHP
jgi:hypothetical protein